ncbi:hypothetical protein HELRODRAFT_185132 [Helobdella robusta]|uniref:Peptidase M28 domain-containing protein n=1 Tax=Helobdella robusta TaxID=6412 RepID=T1FMF7_HELRO|nr:hypothetical protein HELRODRAFT_185132 [Helobdella robusta]ESN94716.1 hypothetical protein HELRODRAFT_185132 [Helobdella robusta]
MMNYYYNSLNSMDKSFRSKMKRKIDTVGVLKIVALILSAAILLVLGFVIGYFTKTAVTHHTSSESVGISEVDVADYLMKEISSENIDKHLKKLTSRPHLSGTPGIHDTVEYIHNFWKQIHLDKTKLISYEVLLSHPSPDNPNSVSVLGQDDSPLFQSQPAEPILRPEDNSSEIVPPFNAYSAAGSVMGTPIYVNYGRVSDFEYVKNLNMTFKDQICVVRYGFNFRADKVALGEKYGCVGMIIYSDPADYAITNTSKVYPDSWLIPGGGVQRGTIKKSSTASGDPLTPLYPATEHAYRLNISEADLPKIPCQPIGYDDARKLLRYFDGEEVPDEWKGGLNITYRFGSKLISGAKAVKVVVNNEFKLDTINNIVGFIEGSVEPDRYVIIGNHYDAWVYGGADPNSGTAVMLEVSRAFMALTKEKGWRPRRSLMFCAWGAEEQGIIGSREFVEEYGLILGQRAVAYLNVDIAVQGRFVFRGKALPMLNTVLFEATKLVPNPDEEEVEHGRKSVYDTWCFRKPEKSSSSSPTSLSSSPSSPNHAVIIDRDDKSHSNYVTIYKDDDDIDDGVVKPIRPRMGLIGSGSDFAPFVISVGTTCADVRFIYDEKLNISSYPLYHTGYETYYLFSKHHDPGFIYSKALGRVWSQMALMLADRVQIPLDPVEYSDFVKSYFQKFKSSNERYLLGFNITLTALSSAVKNFTRAVKDFKARLDKIDLNNVHLVRQYNDQLMNLERSFIDHAGLPDRPAVKHVIFAPSRYNSYAASVFPGVTDAIFDLKQHLHDGEAPKYVEQVKKQLSVLIFMFQRAGANLKESDDFIGRD